MEDTSWQYQETLRRCRAFLVKEYTIKPQVCDLVLYLHEENHITYNHTQDINETRLTSDKMQRLIGILIDCKTDIKAAYDCLRKQMSECGRADIADKLDETLEKVRSEPKPTEEEVPDMVDRIRSDITSFPMTEIHRCLTKVADYIIPEGSGGSHSTDHHQTVAPEVLETQEAAHTKLVLACERGDVEKVEEILTKTPDCVNITNKNGETILMLSCTTGNINVVNTLLKCKVIDVNMQDYNGRTALMKSVIRGDIEVLSMMLDYKNLELSTRDDKGVTYLCYIFGVEAANLLPRLQICLRGGFTHILIRFISNINNVQKAMDWVKVDKVVKCLLSKNNVNHVDLLKTCLILGNPDVVSLVLQPLGQGAIDREIKDYCYSITASINPANTQVLLECGLIDVNDLTTLQVEAITESVMRRGCHELCAYLYKMIRDSDVNEALKTALFLQSISPHILLDILEGMNYDFQRLHITDSVGNTVFAILCKTSRYETVNKLLRHKELLNTIVNKTNKFGESPLIFGCRRGDPDIVRLLLNNDAQVNVGSDSGDTPLTLACESGKKEIVDLLLKKKADLNVRDRIGLSPLMIACQRGDPDMVRLLLNNDAQVNVVDQGGSTPLTAACWSGNIEIVDLLLKKKADLNVRDRMGLSPLMIACERGHPDIVRLLLNNDAQVNVVNEGEDTPLTAACRFGKIEIVDLLLKKKADLNLRDEWGHSPLMIACRRGDPDMVTLLLNNDAQVNVVNEGGDTPLLEACRCGDLEIVRLLLNNDAQVNVVNEDGDTPLTKACWFGKIEIVQLLLKYKADVNACNIHGETPLQIARDRHRDSGIVELLLEHKPDVVD